MPTSHHHRHHHQPNSQTHHPQSKTRPHPPIVSSTSASNSPRSHPSPPPSLASNLLYCPETLVVDQGGCIILHLHHFHPFPSHVDLSNRNHHLLDVTTVRSAILGKIRRKRGGRGTSSDMANRLLFAVGRIM